jgi:hypothetical protein
MAERVFCEIKTFLIKSDAPINARAKSKSIKLEVYRLLAEKMPTAAPQDWQKILRFWVNEKWN